MREDVLILLNEREPQKKAKADELEDQLSHRALATARIPASSEVAAIVLERKPRILVVDYLLGDHGTALDVLQKLDDSSNTDVILWTDEPSVHVAVTAMKSGAKDFIEMGASRSIEKLLSSIESLLLAERQSSPKEKNIQQTERTNDLIYQSPSSRQTLVQADSFAHRKGRAAVLYGEIGSGRSSLAKRIHAERAFAGSFFELRLDQWPGSCEDLFGSKDSKSQTGLLSYGATVLLEHAEADTGEILDAATDWYAQSSDLSAILLVGTSSEPTARAWQKLLETERIAIPSLKERPEDVLPLFQRFSRRIDKKALRNEADIRSTMLEALLTLDWPGNIRQLEASFIDALTSDLENLSEELPTLEDYSLKYDSLTKNQTLLLRGIIAAKNRWERCRIPSDNLPSALSVRHAVDSANGSVRVAAAMLGTGVPQIRAALRPLTERIDGGASNGH